MMDRHEHDRRDHDIRLKDLADKLEQQHRELRHDLDHNQRELHHDLKTIATLLTAVEKPKTGSFAYTVGPTVRKETRMPLTVQSSTEEKVKITVTPLTPGGRPATIEPGTLTVSVVQGNSTTTTIDGASFYIVSEDGPVSPDTLDTVYSVSADADLGAGVVEITDTVTYHVVGAQASTLGLNAASPEPK
jgi:hypothetical protein